MPQSRAAHLEEIYRMIPQVHCKGLCGWDESRQDGCCGPLIMTRLERQKIVQTVGQGPKADPITCKCNMLDEANRCRCYAVRPTICRLWGAVRAMACPYGCKPDRYLTTAEIIRIIRKIQEIGGPVVVDPACAGNDPEQIVSIANTMSYYRKMGL